MRPGDGPGASKPLVPICTFSASSVICGIGCEENFAQCLISDIGRKQRPLASLP